MVSGRLARRIDGTHLTGRRGISKRLVRWNFFLPYSSAFLSHQTDFANACPSWPRERTVSLAIFDGTLGNARVTAVGDHRDGIVQPTVTAPHFARSADRLLPSRRR